MPSQSAVAKLALTIFTEARRMFTQHPDNTGFLTLTFTDHIDNIRIAQQRWHRAQRFLKSLFPRFIAVWERHQSGAIHWHAIVTCKGDIRTGTDVDGLRQRPYPRPGSANPFLKSIYKSILNWTNENPDHWGWNHLEPLYGDIDAAAGYIASYLNKQSHYPKGTRKARFIGFKYDRSCYQTFAWKDSPNDHSYRSKLEQLAKILDFTWEDFAQVFGDKWNQTIWPLLSQEHYAPTPPSKNPEWTTPGDMHRKLRLQARTERLAQMLHRRAQKNPTILASLRDAAMRSGLSQFGILPELSQLPYDQALIMRFLLGLSYDYNAIN